MSTDSSEQILRAKWSGYFVFALLLSPSLALFAYSAVAHPHSRGWENLAGAVALLIAAFAWIAALRIVLTNESVSYKTLFASHEIVFADVQRAEMTQKVVLGFSAPMLKLYDSARYATKPISIPIGAFKPSDIKILGSALKQKNLLPIVVK